MRRTAWSWARPLGGVAILAVVVWRVGTGPFVDGLRRVSAWSLVAASCHRPGHHGVRRLALGPGGPRASASTCPLRAAVAAYYRSQFLNTTLPGGVVGDVHRGVRHGRDAGDVGRGLRAVGVGTFAGQSVQVVLALARARPASVAAALVDARRRPSLAAPRVLVLVLVVRAIPRHGVSRGARALRAARDDVRDGLLARRAWLGIAARLGGRRRRPRGDVPGRGPDRGRELRRRRGCSRWRCSCSSRWRCR